MKEEQIQKLTEPFPAEAICTRRGNHGRELQYVETWRVIERLNKAFDHIWAFRILTWRVLENEVVVHAELEAAGVSKQAVGSSTITRNRDSGEAVSIGDDVKAGGSDALKKAASLFGVGLKLYAGRNGQDTDLNTPTKALSRSTGARKPRAPTPTPEKVPAPSRISERQLSAILALAKSKGGGEVTVRTQVLSAYGVPVERIDRRQASEVISALANGGLQTAGGGA